MKQIHEHFIVKAARSKLREMIAAKFEIITINQIKTQIIKRKKTKKKKLQLQMQKLDASLLKKHQKVIV